MGTVWINNVMFFLFSVMSRQMHRPERLYFMSSIQWRRERSVWQLYIEHCAGESNRGAVCGASGEQLLYYISIRSKWLYEEWDILRPAWKA